MTISFLLHYKIIIIAVLALASSAPQYNYSPPEASAEEEREVVAILKDDRNHEEDGTHSFDFEAANGIKFSQAGTPEGEDDAVIKVGQYSYIAPDGTEVEVKFVADENGFHPHSDLLPVAPAFPHPIPQFVLDQIEKAAEEDALKDLEEAEEDEEEEEEAKTRRTRTSRLYGRPK
ncbi:hypothetical protein SK128_001382 [Halocaridina rubra]|uniref:Larval cuticle protein LCP-17 n=1 Tax=Halocaridina rubra TaxID=373956 RepID=A0AAN8X5Y1_HALRR